MKIGTSERPDLPLAVIVGAGGMGMTIARRLANHYRALIADVDARRVEVRARSLRDDGFDAHGHQCDITRRDSVEELAAVAADRGPLRALVNVAALSPSMGSWQDILGLNLVGAALVEDVLQPVVGQHSAAVFVSSLAAHLQPHPDAPVLRCLDDPLNPAALVELDRRVDDRSSAAAYSLAKLAVNRLCTRKAGEWGRRGARINSMSPGLIATPMGALEFEGTARAAKMALLENSAIPREGTMVETADAVEFLVSERASYITGTDLLVDGGVLAAMRT